MWPAGWLLSTAGTPVFITGVLSYIGYLNIFLGVTNLLPGFPLDGGRVLRAIIWSASGNFLGATKISAAVGRALGIGIALVGAVFIVAPSGGMANFLNGIFLVMVGLFIERSARESLTFALLKAGMEGLTVAEAMYTGLPNVWDEVTLAEAAEHLMRWRVEALPVVNGPGHLRGVLTAGMLNEISRYDWGRARVKDLFEDETAPAFTRPQEPLPAVFILMLRYALVALPVLDAEARIIGMITLRDLYRLAGHRSGMRT
jgi:CBS domain-containing protein